MTRYFSKLHPENKNLSSLKSALMKFRNSTRRVLTTTKSYKPSLKISKVQGKISKLSLSWSKMQTTLFLRKIYVIISSTTSIQRRMLNGSMELPTLGKQFSWNCSKKSSTAQNTRHHVPTLRWNISMVRHSHVSCWWTSALLKNGSSLMTITAMQSWLSRAKELSWSKSRSTPNWDGRVFQLS